MKNSKQKGRPSVKTPELVKEISDRIAKGESLRLIGASASMPTAETLRRWIVEDEEFSVQYARAKEACVHHYAEEIVEIADKAVTRTEVEKARIQVDARKWAASKLNPKKYGDKINLEHSGGVEVKKVEVEIIKPKE